LTRLSDPEAIAIKRVNYKGEDGYSVAFITDSVEKGVMKRLKDYSFKNGSAAIVKDKPDSQSQNPSLKKSSKSPRTTKKSEVNSNTDEPVKRKRGRPPKVDAVKKDAKSSSQKQSQQQEKISGALGFNAPIISDELTVNDSDSSSSPNEMGLLTQEFPLKNYGRKSTGGSLVSRKVAKPAIEKRYLYSKLSAKSEPPENIDSEDGDVPRPRKLSRRDRYAAKLYIFVLNIVPDRVIPRIPCCDKYNHLLEFNHRKLLNQILRQSLIQ
jgi:predicted DNA-binding antitoxin AbrB/MazE fold protein